MPRNNRKDARRSGGFAAATKPPIKRPKPAAGRASGAGRGEIRIIGGRWRGRKLHFPNVPGLRPTPDRVRETLFNWLQFRIAGTRCLDLFAGSGALGLEALSRGAAEVLFVERDPQAADAIREALSLLGGPGLVDRRDAFAFLSEAAPRPFDVVFLDPPYDRHWLPRLCAALESGGWLEPDARIYLEDAAERGETTLPVGWTLLRS
ncbi:MAG TPA: 16S rRNA (guanine(966)-N(2))-methyltransferase RsmD, partial [Steroidobacteraceae bacterium]|nr:16S rRNA (guanine(966)-N(2))-methyltransferase RsmD [Steroidobacteraceae bacterium]